MPSNKQVLQDIKNRLERLEQFLIKLEDSFNQDLNSETRNQIDHAAKIVDDAIKQHENLLRNPQELEGKAADEYSDYLVKLDREYKEAVSEIIDIEIKKIHDECIMQLDGLR